MKILALLEALKPSQYRSLVKGWDKKRLEQEFKAQPYKKDKKAYRLYIPVPQDSNTVVQPNPQIKQHLDKEGFEIVDYIKGQVKKKSDGRIFRLGKVLPDNLKQAFANDPARQATSKQTVAVISRHPYDVAGMSTNRGWTSCQDLEDGSQCAYVPVDIDAGTLIAYETAAKDIDLKKPMGRILIKPYLNYKNETAFGIASQSYGTVSQNFLKIIEDWIEDFNNRRGVKGFFTLHPHVYGEAKRLKNIGDINFANISQEELVYIGKNDRDLFGKALANGAKPTEDSIIQILEGGAVVSVLSALYDHEIEVTPAIQRSAIVKDLIRAIRIIFRYERKDISTRVQIYAANHANYRNAYDLFEEYVRVDRSVPLEVQKILVKKDPEIIEEMANRYDEINEEVLEAAIKSPLATEQILIYLHINGIKISNRIMAMAINRIGPTQVEELESRGIKIPQEVKKAVQSA